MRKIKVLSTFIDLETQSTLSLSLLQQLDTTVVVAYLCSLFIRRTLVELKQKQKDERTSRLLSPLLSLVLVIDTEEWDHATESWEPSCKQVTRAASLTRILLSFSFCMLLSTVFLYTFTLS